MLYMLGYLLPTYCKYCRTGNLCVLQRKDCATNNYLDTRNFFLVFVSVAEKKFTKYDFFGTRDYNEKLHAIRFFCTCTFGEKKLLALVTKNDQWPLSPFDLVPALGTPKMVGVGYVAILPPCGPHVATIHFRSCLRFGDPQDGKGI